MPNENIEQGLFDFATQMPQVTFNDWKPKAPVKGARYYRWEIGGKTVYAELLTAGLKYMHKPHWGRGNFWLNMLTLWTDSGWWMETECGTFPKKSLRVPTDAEERKRARLPIAMRHEDQRLDEAAFAEAKAFARDVDKPVSEGAKWFMEGRMAPWKSEDFKVWGYTCRAQVQYGQLIVLCTYEDQPDRWKDALFLEVDYDRERGTFDVFNAPVHGQRARIHEGGFGESANRFTPQMQWEDPKFTELARILGFAIGNFLSIRDAA